MTRLARIIGAVQPARFRCPSPGFAAWAAALGLTLCCLAGPGLAAETGADRIASPPPISPRLAGDPVFTPPPAKDGYAYPDCFCVNKGGERTPMGGSACIEIGSTRYTARCGMSLNIPAWRKLRDGCDPGPGVLLLERFERLKPG